MHIVLVEPEIHGNTGSVARTTAVTGTTLHLVEPLGFSLEDRYLKRAGLDYWPLVDLHVHPNLEAVLSQAPLERRHLFTTRSDAPYTSVPYTWDDWLFFGRESVGLPEGFLEAHPERCWRIPMRPVPGARSLNLANAVSIVLYEALRQLNFPGLS